MLKFIWANLLMILVVLAIFLLSTATEAFSAMRNPEEFIRKDNAIVQILTKQSGRTQTITIPTGQPLEFERLTVNVRECLVTDEFLPENFYMFVDITKRGQQIFYGWMSRNEPGQNPLQDPDHDLWLVRCE